MISVYAPTLEKCEKDTNIREEFYDQLEKTISDVPNRDVLFIAGDLNAKTGSEYRNFKNHMGKFGKGKANSSGIRLLEMCKKFDLFLTNTIFNHKLSHRTTWTAPYRNYVTHDGTQRRNPIRNQIDYVITRNRYRRLITDSRSYGGFLTETDHKIVKITVKLEWRNIYQKNENKEKINTQKFHDTATQIKYKNKLAEQHIAKEITPGQKWKKIVEMSLEA